MVPGQPPLSEQGDSRGGGGYFLRPAPSPLGPKGFKPPTLPQLYAALSSPEQRGWLDALQVSLVANIGGKVADELSCVAVILR